MLGSLLMTVLAVYFPVKKLLFPSGCGRPPATADCYDHANAATDCNALPCAESRFSELVFLEAGEPIGAREETGKRREGTSLPNPRYRRLHWCCPCRDGDGEVSRARAIIACSML